MLTPWRLGRRSPPATTFASARPQCRYPCVFSPAAFLCLMKSSFNQTLHFRPTRRGCFFQAKAQKKSTPDGSANQCSVFDSIEVITPRQFRFESSANAIAARSPLTACGNVRVGPTAMSLSMRFFADCIPVLDEFLLQPNTSFQADSEGVFFSSESAEKKHTGWVGQSVSL
ncbi:MAG: hypothetical protein ACKO69_00340 [Limnohabitans sp.]